MAVEKNTTSLRVSHCEERSKLKQSVSLIPKLRFKEFEGKWEETTLGDLFTFKNGLNSDKEKYGSGIKFINVLDIIGEAVITYDSIIGKVEVTDKELEKNEVIYGDVLFQRSSETREEVGQANVYVDKNKSAVFGGFVIRGRKKVDYDPYFINYLLKNSSARKEITTKSGGSTRYNVGQNSLSEVFVKLTSIPEQQKIATFLTSVDTKIQQLTTKKQLLENYKKGIMQQLFRQQLRFKPDVIARASSELVIARHEAISQNESEFPDWEEKKLGEVCFMTSSKRVYLDDYVKEGIPFYRGKEISELRLNKKPSDILYITKERYEDFKSKYGVPLKNDILITAVGTLGNALRIRNDEPFYFKDGNLIWIKDITENPEFLEILLDWETKELIKTSIGSTQKALTMIELRKLKFKFPSLKEQQKIATYLSAIDTKIENIQTQITKTQAFKKGLLQQLFV